MSDIKEMVTQTLMNEVSFMVMEFWQSDYSEKCASEIERAFAAAMILSASLRRIGVSFSREIALRDKVEFFLEPQFVIGDYRVDFLFGDLAHAGNLLSCIAIECDGHDFHDKTKEQAARDKSRDRFLSTKVGRVLRFTGSEIFRDPGACGLETLAVLRAMNVDRGL